MLECGVTNDFDIKCTAVPDEGLDGFQLLSLKTKVSLRMDGQTDYLPLFLADHMTL